MAVKNISEFLPQGDFFKLRLRSAVYNAVGEEEIRWRQNTAMR